MKTTTRKFSIAAVIATAALLFTGCGGTPTPSPSPSQATGTATATASASPTATAKPSDNGSNASSTKDGGSAANGSGSTATACAADSVQIPGSHGQYGEVDATFEPAVDALVASGTSREEANRQVLLAHAKNNVQRLAIWSFAAHLWADPNNTAGLAKDGCLSPEGHALWQKFADAVGDASIVMGNAPLDGTDSGIVNDQYVVADHPGINGSTIAAIVTLKDGTVITISEWCGNVIYMIVKPIVPKSPAIVQHPTPKYVLVCDTVTKTDGVRVTVEEAANARYVAVGSIACKPQPPNVQRCDSQTKTDNVTVTEEQAKDTNRYKPVGDVACHPVEVIKACIKGSGDQTLRPVDKFDDKTMSTNPADCVKPPKNVQRCDSQTKTDNVTVTEEQAKDTNRYKPVGDVACHPPVVEKIKVCIRNSGNQTLVPIDKKDFDSATMSTNPADCVKIPETMQVCIKASGDQTLVTIDKKDFNPATMSTNPADCVKPPKNVQRCDSQTKTDNVTVTEEQAKDTNRYKPVGDVACYPKSANPGDYTHEVGAPPAVADPTPSAPGLGNTTTTPGGRGNTVVDTPSNTNAGSTTGTTAPGATAPNPTPPTQVNEGGATDSNGTNSGTVASNPIDAATVVTAAPAAVNTQAAAAAAQAAANQASKDAADIAAVQAARAQAQATAQAAQQAAAQQQAAATQKAAAAQQAQAAQAQATAAAKATAHTAAQTAPAAASPAGSTAAGVHLVAVTTPAAPAAHVGG